MADQGDQSANYNTPLTPAEEASFQRWRAQLASNPRTSDLANESDYDLRGAWKANAHAAANGHLPDTWKKPNHPTFNSQSIYSGPATQGGAWVDPVDPQLERRGKGYTYFASPDQQRYGWGSDALQNYFRQVEPGNALVPAQNGFALPLAPNALTAGAH